MLSRIHCSQTHKADDKLYLLFLLCVLVLAKFPMNRCPNQLIAWLQIPQAEPEGLRPPGERKKVPEQMLSQGWSWKFEMFKMHVQERPRIRRTWGILLGAHGFPRSVEFEQGPDILSYSVTILSLAKWPSTDESTWDPPWFSLVLPQKLSILWPKDLILGAS